MNFVQIATLLLSALFFGSLVYLGLTVVAARHYLRTASPVSRLAPPVSILCPLHGVDNETEENLRSRFCQDYPNFEVLTAVRTISDPAAVTFEKVRSEFPNIPARLIVAGEAPTPNAKAHSLDALVAEANNDLLVMLDSDVRVGSSMLRTIAAELEDESVGVITCPYRAQAGPSFWSRLEAIGMNTEFLGGVLVGRLLEGMKFALGPGIAAHRRVIHAVGGFSALGKFLAEDFVLGKRAAQLGYRVLLSSHIIEHRIGSQSFLANLGHRLRWARSTRRSRPVGYLGEMLVNPLLPTLLLFLTNRNLWPLVIMTLIFRLLSAWATSTLVLSCPLSVVTSLLIPVQDVLSFSIWMAGFWGNTVQWGGRRVELLPDGRFSGAPTQIVLGKQQTALPG